MNFDVVLHALSSGKLHFLGELLRGSNSSFLVSIDASNTAPMMAVYKPAAGENPLWDFPPYTLAHREVAAFLVSQALGWELVPPTVYRLDAPLGEGSLQLFIPHDPQRHYFNLTETEKAILPQVVLFDLLINNADRKGGHFLIDENNHLWLIDHGICFHKEWKLRTVVWELSGQPIPISLRKAIGSLLPMLSEDLGEQLSLHLSAEELQSLAQRAKWLRRLRRFPFPPKHTIFYPFPLI